MNRQSITICGRHYGPADLDLLRRHEQRFVREDLADFLTEWYADAPTVTVQSSGSTGAPKIMHVEKTRMQASARMTCSFLGLTPGDTALLCMPLRYIGAKMMVVRALEAGLDLRAVDPSGHALHGVTPAPDFLAMTPAQVFSSLEKEDEAETLRQTKHLIIGGSAVDDTLVHRLSEFPHGVWSTYGMTETLSHIALRRLNGPGASEWYTPFAGVSLRLSSEATLAIKAPAVCAEEIVTNDLAEFDATGRFRILGRKDNTINSGGIKLQIEAVEAQLLPTMPCAFQIVPAPDAKFGEVVAMLVEEHRDDWRPYMAHLHPYARPKHVFTVSALPRTGSGKPDRAAAKAMICQLLEHDHAQHSSERS
ncbi:MAG TPA: AMP-binding protein [Candidatus Avidesulfovibrio excrementigallinarum]|nr:AMP-binding protein [Candidatus Avidesulfovibrio excrementigallinarum]